MSAACCHPQFLYLLHRSFVILGNKIPLADNAFSCVSTYRDRRLCSHIFCCVCSCLFLVVLLCLDFIVVNRIFPPGLLCRVTGNTRFGKAKIRIICHTAKSFIHYFQKMCGFYRSEAFYLAFFKQTEGEML